MSSTLDSEAVFRARALQVGLDAQGLDTIVAAGVKTFSTLAFACSYTPGASDDSTFIALVNQLFGRDPGIATTSIMRRLHLESHTMALQDVRSRLERTDESTPVRVLQAERSARYEDQKRRLSGLSLIGEYECSHALIDAVFQMYEDDVLRYLPLESLTSREAEMQGQGKKDKVLGDIVAKIEAGKVKEWKVVGDDAVQADLSTDLRIRAAWTRRSLAFDQANLISFSTSEAWIETMIRKMQEQPPPRYKTVTLGQCLAADKRLWQRLAEACRSGIRPVASAVGVTKPLEAAMQIWCHHTEVLYFMQPLPAMGNSGGVARDEVDGVNRGKGKGRGKNRGKNKVVKNGDWSPEKTSRQGKGKGRASGDDKKKVPKGCCGMTADGKRICFAFNGDGCQAAAVGETCPRGFHVCGRKACFGLHPMSACPLVAA